MQSRERDSRKTSISDENILFKCFLLFYYARAYYLIFYTCTRWSASINFLTLCLCSSYAFFTLIICLDFFCSIAFSWFILMQNYMNFEFDLFWWLFHYYISLTWLIFKIITSICVLYRTAAVDLDSNLHLLYSTSHWNSDIRLEYGHVTSTSGVSLLFFPGCIYFYYSVHFPNLKTHEIFIQETHS